MAKKGNEIVIVSPKTRSTSGAMKRMRDQLADAKKGYSRTLSRVRAKGKEAGSRATAAVSAAASGYALGTYVGGLEAEGRAVPNIGETKYTYLDAAVVASALAVVTNVGGKYSQEVQAAAHGVIAIAMYERARASAKADALIVEPGAV
jgi:hypothetical protein